MPKLRLFQDTDPLESDVIPFPRAPQDRFELRLTDPIEEVQQAVDAAQSRLDEVQAILNDGWFDDDPPRAA